MAHSRVAAKSMLVQVGLLSLINLTLYKLLHFAHGLLRARHDRPLVDEPFQVWKYGPVPESLYHELKPFGASPVLPKSWFVATWTRCCRKRLTKRRQSIRFCSNSATSQR